jgi:hypothetical protein
MRQLVRTTLRLRRVRSTLLLHGLPPLLPQGTPAFPAYRLVRWEIVGARHPPPATLFEQAERLPLDQRRDLIERLLAKMPPDKPESEPTFLLEIVPVAPKTCGFVEFYRVYPLHVARGAAERAYRRIIAKGEATEAELLAGAMRYAAAQDGKDPTYIKHPATWLNGKCWLDEPAPAAPRPRSYLDSIRAGLAVHLDKEGA